MVKRKDAPNAPGRGTKVPDELIGKFKVEYLRTGVVASAARACGLDKFTCYKYADEAEADPLFQRARKLLLTRGLDEVESMVINSARIAAERIEEGPQVDGMGGIVDSGPQYLRGLVDAHRSLVGRRKAEDDIAARQGPAPTGPLEIVIRRAGKTEEKPNV
jgi:hypothetical protein